MWMLDCRRRDGQHFERCCEGARAGGSKLGYVSGNHCCCGVNLCNRMVSNLTAHQIPLVTRNESREFRSSCPGWFDLVQPNLRSSGLVFDRSGRMLDIEPRVVPRSKTKKKIQRRPLPTCEEKVVIGETDMPEALQSHAVMAASEALDMHEATDFKEVAVYIKNQFDKAYGSGWQCVTGVTFGSYVTHSSGSFIHFCLGRLAIMLFKSAC